MTFVQLSQPSLLERFQGCMIGALVGDCLGSEYEFFPPMAKSLHSYMTKILSGERTTVLRHTDDTAMTLSMAKSLVEKGEIDPNDLAHRFVEEYYRDSRRCYGGHVIHIFKSLKDSDFSDVFLPAQKQFQGKGSFGNGSAMRIAPAALFGSVKGVACIEDAVKLSSRITHTHHLGINGALLQAFAINHALALNPQNKLNPSGFIKTLKNQIKDLEGEDLTYCKNLKKVKKIIKKKRLNGKDIALNLGNTTLAQESVQTAIYAFLRGMHPLADFDCPNPFMRTMYCAISIGGDTDTIASMAGAIAGAYYGVEIIPQVVKERCELIQEISDVADKLYACCYPSDT